MEDVPTFMYCFLSQGLDHRQRIEVLILKNHLIIHFLILDQTEKKNMENDYMNQKAGSVTIATVNRKETNTTSSHLAPHHDFNEDEGFMPCFFCLLGGHRFLLFESLALFRPLVQLDGRSPCLDLQRHYLHPLGALCHNRLIGNGVSIGQHSGGSLHGRQR
jgi:hypothetical protein